VLLIAQGRIAEGVAFVGVLATLSGSVMSLLAPTKSTFWLSHIGGLSTSIVVGYVVGRAVFAPGVVNAHRVRGAIVLYLNFAFIFLTAYRLLRDISPDAFAGLSGMVSWRALGSLLYFSFVTLTSVGYGDIVPVHPIARSLSNLEAIIGQLFPATLLVRLITLQLEARRRA
jgi:voltage-gated potassium channel Kch